MKAQRSLLIGIGVVLVAAALVLFGLFVYNPAQHLEETVEEAVPTVFSSTELGVAFQYPSTYTLQTHEVDGEERAWTALTLIDTKILQQAQENGASEGPPAIAIQVFPNVEGYTAKGWVEGMSYSNYKLSNDQTLIPVTVGGVEGVAYRYSGLFETDAVVVATGSKVYMFSVDWLTEADENIHEFSHVLESVTFI